MKEKRELEIKATVNDQASKGFKQIGDQLKSLGKSARGALNSLPNLVAAIAAGAAVRKGVQVFNDLATGLDEINLAAASINTTAESLYLLRNAAGENGIEFSELAAAMRTFEVAVGDAQLGSVAQREALQRLGLDVSTLSGKNKDAVDTFAQVADALATVENSSIRTKLALQLFGEDTGAKLLPLLQKGGASLREYAAAQQAAGKALTSEQIQRASDYRVAIGDLTNTLQAFAEQIVLEVAPAVTDLFQDLRKSIDENSPAIKEGMIEIAVVVAQGAELIVDLGFIARRSVLGLDLLAKSIDRFYRGLGGTAEEVRESEMQLRASNEAVAQNEKAWAELGERFDSIRNKIRSLRDEQAQQNRDAQRGPVDGGRVTATAELPTDLDLFFEGFSENVEKAKVKWQDFYQAGLDASSQLVDRGLNRLSDSFADILTRTKNQKEAFKELARSMVADIARIISRLLIMRAIRAGSSVLGIALEDGGVVSGSMSKPVKAQAFASGGIATSPTLALFGEGRGAEAFVPLPDGRTIPVTMSGGGGEGMVVNFNISAVDGPSVDRMLRAQKGTIQTIIAESAGGRSNAFRQSMQRSMN